MIQIFFRSVNRFWIQQLTSKTAPMMEMTKSQQEWWLQDQEEGGGSSPAASTPQREEEQEEDHTTYTKNHQKMILKAQKSKGNKQW